MKNYISLILVIVLLISVFGCKTTPEPDPLPEDEPAIVETEPEVEEEPAPEPVIEEEPEPEPEPVEEMEPVEETEDFVVTQEVFEETFVDIEELIGELNGIIRSKNYDTWLGYLTSEYKEHYSDQERLLDMSQQPILKKYGIRLRSLRDYFEYVVVPSRSQAKLDDLVFTDNEHIKAIMIINGKRSILYSLEKIDGTWKIGV